MLSSGARAGGGASGLGAAAREVNVFFTHFLSFSLAAPAHMRPPTGCWHTTFFFFFHIQVASEVKDTSAPWGLLSRHFFFLMSTMHHTQHTRAAQSRRCALFFFFWHNILQCFVSSLFLHSTHTLTTMHHTHTCDIVCAHARSQGSAPLTHSFPHVTHAHTRMTHTHHHHLRTLD